MENVIGEYREVSDVRLVDTSSGELVHGQRPNRRTSEKGAKSSPPPG